MRGADRRQQVLQIAAEEFANGGLHGASTETIARRIALQKCRDYGAEQPRIVVCVYSGD